MTHTSPHGVRPISEVASDLGLEPGQWHPVVRDVAKIDLDILKHARRRDTASRLILVSAITPTRAGEGKTTTSIGLAQGLRQLGESVCLALREPSLGPTMGIKGGATGGGRSRLFPEERINLHFTGDFHAVTTAHNLLAAILDNHLYFDNQLGIDPRRVLWRRVIDMNDRSLRKMVIGLGGHREGIPRETGFDITAASEIMAILCLAENMEDLRERLDRVLVALTYDGQPVTAKQLTASGAMLAVLQDAIEPNLTQTIEGAPALIHGGPFANIAHGCSSVIATRMAMHLADWAVTEAGFGFDLGAEKFYDIKCRSAGLDTAAVVLVATIRALKMHGGSNQAEAAVADPDAVQAGLPNLEKHIESIGHFGEVPVVALNRFNTDSDEEIAVVSRRCEELGVPFAVSDHFARGGAGAVELARTVVEHAERVSRPFKPLYPLDASVSDKVLAIASRMYGAGRVVFTKSAQRDLQEIETLGYQKLPICIAKTPASLSDDSSLRGRPTGFDVTVRALQINAGAGFLVALTGDVMRMPGLPQHPRAARIDVRNGEISGLA